MVGHLARMKEGRSVLRLLRGKLTAKRNLESLINPIPGIHTYFFKVYSNIVLPSSPRPRHWSRSYRFTNKNVEITPTFLHSGYELPLSIL